MSPDEGIDMRDDILILVKIFHQSYMEDDRIKWDIDEYIKAYESEIEDAGVIFKYLRLATVDDKSPLGWRPTQRFMDLLVGRAMGVKRKFYPCGLLISLMCCCAFNKSGWRGELAIATMEKLQLIRRDESA